MCGIVGAISSKNVSELLLKSLKRLEYRGYDSAGIAIIDHNFHLKCLRVAGRIDALTAKYMKSPFDGTIGIGHTRWATHGKVTKNNAHPIFCKGVAIVHNGIIENHQELYKKTKSLGFKKRSETDSEVIAHLIASELREESDLLIVFRETIKRLQGNFAIASIIEKDPSNIFVASFGNPIVIGRGVGENFIASDLQALKRVCNRFTFLEDSDIAKISRDNITIYNNQFDIIQRKELVLNFKEKQAEIGKYKHFIQKEIYEQPEVIEKTWNFYINNSREKIMEVPDFKKLIDHLKIKNIYLVACGTSYHAALVARYWFEEFSNIFCCVERASEWYYRKKVILPNSLFIAISQSGETADTLACLKQAKNLPFVKCMAICNVFYSTLVRIADSALLTRAGSEKSVCSTKAFTTQLLAFLFMLSSFGREEVCYKIISLVEDLPRIVRETLRVEKNIKELSKHIVKLKNVLFIGRGVDYPIALEGALKLEELTYIHANAYPGGELKHGPLALIDNKLIVIALCFADLREKMQINLQEISARGGRLIIFTDQKEIIKIKNVVNVIRLPSIDPILRPIITVIPLQLLAYHVAKLKGCDIDKPRNLAKSVTVE